MDWDAVWERLAPAFAEIIERVRQVYPGIHAGATRAPLGYAKFAANAEFSHDVLAQEQEDLGPWFKCAPADAGTFSDPGGRKLFPDAGDRDAIGFWIERGSGFELATLDPVLLPLDEGSPAYRRAVLDFTDKAVEFIRHQTDLILDALKQPIEPRD